MVNIFKLLFQHWCIHVLTSDRLSLVRGSWTYWYLLWELFESNEMPPFLGKNVITSDREAVKVGDHVTLTCNTTCTLSSSPSFIWSKDGRPVEKNQSINNQLLLHPVRYEDGGSYTCAVTGHEDLPSQPFRLQLMSKCYITRHNRFMFTAVVPLVEEM